MFEIPTALLCFIMSLINFVEYISVRNKQQRHRHREYKYFYSLYWGYSCTERPIIQYSLIPETLSHSYIRQHRHNFSPYNLIANY